MLTIEVASKDKQRGYAALAETLRLTKSSPRGRSKLALPFRAPGWRRRPAALAACCG